MGDGKNTIDRSNHWHIFFKVSVLKNFATFIVKHLQLYLKETPTEVFTSEYHEICNSFLSFFYRAPLVAASTLTNVKMINYSGAREVARTPVNIYDEQLCNSSYRLLIIFDKLFMFAGSLRSNHRRCCVRKGLLEISQNSYENTCAKVSFLIKLRPSTLLKKILWHKCFPVNSETFLRTPFLQNISRRLLL